MILSRRRGWIGVACGFGALCMLLLVTNDRIPLLAGMFSGLREPHLGVWYREGSVGIAYSAELYNLPNDEQMRVLTRHRAWHSFSALGFKIEWGRDGFVQTISGPSTTGGGNYFYTGGLSPCRLGWCCCYFSPVSCDCFTRHASWLDAARAADTAFARRRHAVRSAAGWRAKTFLKRRERSRQDSNLRPMD